MINQRETEREAKLTDARIEYLKAELRAELKRHERATSRLNAQLRDFESRKQALAEAAK